MMKQAFCLLVTLAVAKCVVFKDCGSTTGMVKEVDVDPCPAEPCILKHNTTTTIFIDFVSKVNTTKVTAVVAGIIDGVPIPFPIPQPDGCKSKVKCPITANDENTYTYGLYVSTIYPKLKVVIRYELKDDQGKDLVCILVPAEITD